MLFQFYVDILRTIGRLVLTACKTAGLLVEPVMLGDVWAVVRIVGDVVNKDGVADVVVVLKASKESSYSFS